jgi:hypothetical protein
VYRLLQQPVPDELFVANISTAPAPRADLAPTGLISPILDGEETSYFEWLGAGQFEVRDAAGAMHQTTRPASVLTGIRFGFDRERFYVRLDGHIRLAELVAQGYEFSLNFLRPEGLRVSVRPNGTADLVASAAGSILELAIPLARLEPVAGLSFFVTVQNAEGLELERHPSGHPLEVRGLDERFVSRNWTA